MSLLHTGRLVCMTLLLMVTGQCVLVVSANEHKSCTGTMSRADENGDNHLSRAEFTQFVTNEASKLSGHNNAYSVDGTTEGDEGLIKSLFDTFADSSTGLIDTTSSEAGQRAFLELICERTKVALASATSIVDDGMRVEEGPFKGERPSEKQGLNIDFIFNLFGADINLDIAQASCPQEFTTLVSCFISTCPQFLEVCPDQGLLGSNEGIMTDGDVIPECEDFNRGFCDNVDGPPECCMNDCEVPRYELILCLTFATAGADRTDCQAAGDSPCQLLPDDGGIAVDDGSANVTDDAGSTNTTDDVSAESFCSENQDCPSIQCIKAPCPEAICVDGFCDIQVLDDTNTESSDNFVFPFGGGYIPPDLVIASCPGEWDALLSCVLGFCPNAGDVCAFEGSAVDGLDLKPGCSGLAKEFCAAVDYPDGCCLWSSCISPFYDLTKCVASADTGDDSLLLCEDPECLAQLPSYSNDTQEEPFTGLLEEPIATLLDSLIYRFSTDFLGPNITVELTEQNCDEELSNTISCIAQDCSDFSAVCPLTDLFGEVGGVNDSEESFMALDITPGCSELDEGFCGRFSFQEGCCLSTCTDPLYILVSCIASYAIDKDLSTCEVARCSNGTDIASPQQETFSASSNATSSPILVNSSFLISSLNNGLGAAELKKELGAGGLEALREAYRTFVQSIVGGLLGTGDSLSVRRELGNTVLRWATSTRYPRKLASTYDEESPEIYDFIDSPCPTADAITSASKQEENKTCITVFGRYSILAAPEDDVEQIYQRFVQATQVSIDAGNLGERLQELVSSTNLTTPFAVEGVSEVVDESFSPFANIEGATTADQSAQTNVPAPNTTQPPDAPTANATKPPDAPTPDATQPPDEAKSEALALPTGFAISSFAAPIVTVFLSLI